MIEGQNIQVDEKEQLKRYIDLVYLRCHRILRSEDLAWDALQEVFANFYKAMQNKHIYDPIGYLNRSSTNHCINVLKKHKRTVLFPTEIFDLKPSKADHTEIEFGVLLEQLSLEFGSDEIYMLVHRYVDQMTYGEIAALYQISDRGVKKKLDRLKPKLREFLATSMQEDGE